MPSDPNLVQLVTLVPATLRRKVKIHCIEQDSTVMQFVIEALTKALESESASESSRSNGTGRRAARS